MLMDHDLNMDGESEIDSDSARATESEHLHTIVLCMMNGKNVMLLPSARSPSDSCMHDVMHQRRSASVLSASSGWAESMLCRSGRTDLAHRRNGGLRECAMDSGLIMCELVERGKKGAFPYGLVGHHPMAVEHTNGLVF